MYSKKKIIETYDKDARRYKFIDIPNLKGKKTVKEMSDKYYETHDPIANRDNFQEHEDYVLAFRVGAGLLPEHQRWASINPNTVFDINRVAV